MKSKRTILISACLLGQNCRYDGEANPSDSLMALAKKEEITLIPICPEQYGGLPTPRPPCEITGGHVLQKDGTDVSSAFLKGAHETLKMAKLFQADLCILKAKSPSCGSNFVYDGTFTKTLMQADGITAALLKDHGYQVITEEDWEDWFVEYRQ